MISAFRLITAGFTLGIGAAFAAGMALWQDEPAAPQGMNQDAMAMLQAMSEAHENPTAPGPFHEKLERFIGDWDVTARAWPMGPDMPPVEAKATATAKWMLDGRFVHEEIEGDFEMQGMTMPIDAVTIVGYDNYRNQYVGAHFAAMSTEMIPFHGGVSPDGKTFNYYGTMHEPMLNVAGRMIRIETTITGENSHTVSIYDLFAGPDHKSVEFVYQRR